MKNLILAISISSGLFLCSCERGPKYQKSPEQIKAGESIPKHDVDTLAGKDKTRITDSMSGKKAH